MMLSEFEYSYSRPGPELELLGRERQQDPRRRRLLQGSSRALLERLGPGVVRDPAGVLQKLAQRHLRPGPGRPGSTCRRCRQRTACRRATSDRATAPLNAFDTLASRIESNARIGAPVATLAVPARCSTARPPRCTTTAIPGGPSGCRTSRVRARSSAVSAARAALAASHPRSPAPHPRSPARCCPGRRAPWSAPLPTLTAVRTERSTCAQASGQP